MSEELISFNTRVNDLNAVLKSLLEIQNDAKTTAELLTQQQKLNLLSSIVRNRGTLNTGGHFEWVDSKIVRALKIGQYICLEHVNLCSSAILDRLNSVFETNGKLLLSEKGVTSNNQSESVSRHAEFRAFLTMDPRNGEISRAMRNRCIELCLTDDAYSRDDLKQLIYQNGIHDQYLIEWTLNIHFRVQKISEFHAFNVSHLTNFAFLINENLRLGADEAKALFDSALIVYVRTSHIDLLGFGLSYYHEKLTDEIRNEIQNVPDKCQNMVNISNLIISADNINSLALIRLQCEPLIMSIKCLCMGIDREKVQLVFNAAREQFSSLHIDLDWKLTEYLLYMLYEMSSMHDLSARRTYIDVKIREQLTDTNEIYHSNLQKLLDLNGTMAQRIRISLAPGQNAILQAVPWNQHMLPRLRDYLEQTSSLTKTDQLKLGTILFASISFDQIDIDTTKLRQSQISAITYSQAVNAGTIPNGLNIDLITFLHPLLDSIKEFAVHIIKNLTSLNYHQYSELICAFFWANRLHEVSKSILFKDKTVNQTLLDKLALHFNWLVKYLTVPLNELTEAKAYRSKEIAQFRKILTTISECNTIRRYPLNEMRKHFTKQLTEFMPYYEECQIQMHEYETEVIKHQQLPTRKWQSYKADEYLQSLINKYRIVLSDEMVNYKNYLVESSDDQELRRLGLHNTSNMDLETVQEISAIENLNHLTEESAKFERYLESINDNANQSQLAPLKLLVSILPIMEYFALRALNSILRKNVAHFQLNADFFKSIRSLDVTVLNAIRTVGTTQYASVESTWHQITNLLTDSDGIESVFTVVPQSIYRKLSSFMKMLDSRIFRFNYNSLTLNHQYLLNCSDTDTRPEAISTNSCALTVSAFLSLFNEYGKSKSIGLGNLDVWTSTLTSISKSLWNNVETFQSHFAFEQTNLDYSKQCGRKLLKEVKFIQSIAEKKSSTQKSSIEMEFWAVVDRLEKFVSMEIQSESKSTGSRFNQFYTAALIQSLMAIIELHLMTFTPLVDPVEKNRLKKTYTEESQQHINRLVSAYDFMKIIMSYDGLGEQIIDESLRSKTKELKISLEKYSKKCALRPEQCMYSELVDQINFFLENGCRPNSQLQLIDDIDLMFNALNRQQRISSNELQMVDEIIKRIDWCTNTAESFERSTIARFATYYRDFTAPIESSVVMLKVSFRSLKQCLIKMRDTILMSKFGNKFIVGPEPLPTVIASLIEFPSVAKGSLLMPTILRMLDGLNNKEAAHSQ